MGNLSRVLLVDDEENLLTGLKRHLRGQFDVVTASSGQAALQIVSDQEAFSVVVSDMQMPEMDGVELLGEIKKVAPLTIRMMLTGNADQETAVKAINNGSIFHFFNKPCDADAFAHGINEGVTQYRLQTAEKELIETTLVGSIKQLTDVIALARPHVAQQVEMMRRWARKVAETMGLEKTWELDLVYMLSQIGLVGVPPNLLDKIDQRKPLSDSEQELYQSVPKIGADIVGHVPRLENVAKAILYQAKNYDGSGFPEDQVSGEDIPVVARILKITNAIVSLTAGETPGQIGFQYLRSETGKYDEAILDIAERILVKDQGSTPNNDTDQTSEFVPVSLLRPGATLASDIQFTDGHLILAKGNQLTDALVHRLRGIHQTKRIAEPIEIYCNGR